MGPARVYLFGIAAFVLGMVGLLHPDTADRTWPFWFQMLVLLGLSIGGLVIVVAPIAVWLLRIGRRR